MREWRLPHGSFEKQMPEIFASAFYGLFATKEILGVTHMFEMELF